MAYMCADSGNLMAIAQQVIQQKQQQQQQQQQQQINGGGNGGFALNPWSHHSGFLNPRLPNDGAGFGSASATAMGFSDGYGGGAAAVEAEPPVLIYPPLEQERPGGLHMWPEHRNGLRSPIPFKLSDLHLQGLSSGGAGFEGDEWMECLMGDFHGVESGGSLRSCFESGPCESTESSELPSTGEPWRADFSAIISEPPFAQTLSPPLETKANIISEQQQQNPNFPTATLPQPIQPWQPEAVPSAECRKPPDGRSMPPLVNRDPPPPPLLLSLVDAARTVHSDPGHAAASLAELRRSAPDSGSPTERLVSYFAEALIERLDPTGHPVAQFSAEESTLCYKALNDACPFSKFAHLTANQAILEAMETADSIHIVDFGIVQGVQWAALLQALATRPAGKPAKIRISGIPAPSLGSNPAPSLAATGNRLCDFAKLLELNFEFSPVPCSIEDVMEGDLRRADGEFVAVNFMLQLHRLVDEKMEKVARALRVAKALKPKVVTLGEYELGLNRGDFMGRLSRALRYYGAMFECLEAGMGRACKERERVERVVIGRRIAGAVKNTERMEERCIWREEIERAGFVGLGLSHYAVSQARMLLWNYDYSSSYSLIEAGPGFLTLAWKDQPLLTVSAWR
ncbi:scarecrow-like protein 4 isoform X1 [Amborella trichopoda]|uniref:Uncharacterized protein n=2 Tax=Amborella trichopoda TaxID=13333 RepID=U5D7T9_AMBTC|nr:scarecrow-like protein 4 isoform X1 [Amborella trichopoda]ERN17487.1 hypothetical protein AMTR_s00059p00051820 [Amborella trichopoda]|eukprot:XP_006856020.1 scarecrow-like protein 4 isoform X1 [Amborella trichopoda]